MHKTLSKDAEEKIISAVKRAVSLVDNDGLTPTDAVEKVASEEGWGHEMIRFASHAYNTGRQTAQREVHDSILSKFADFPLVDPEAVIGRLWPTQVKSAVDAEQATGVSVEYAAPPTFHLARERRELLASLHAGTVKVASVTTPAAPTYSQVSDEHKRLKRAAEEARHMAAAVYDRLLSGLDRLATYFRKSAMDRLPFAQVELAVNTYLGDAGKQLLDWTYERVRLKEARSKDVKMAALAEYDPSHEPYSLIQSCMSLGRNVAQWRQHEKTAKDKCDAYAKEFVHPFTQAPALKTAEAATSVLQMPSDGAEKAAGSGGLGMMMPAAVGVSTKELLDKAMTGGPQTSDRVNDAWQEMEDPAHDAQLRQIRTQAMLADLMNDEVIGTYDPDVVMNKFNEISQLAPRTAQQPVAIRSLLRRHLAGSVEPHEVQQTTDLEKGMIGTEKDTPNTRIMRETPDSILG